MKIAIASDHAGFDTKTFIVGYLKGKGIEVADLGTNNDTSVDYPLYADKVAAHILARESVYLSALTDIKVFVPLFSIQMM